MYLIYFDESGNSGTNLADPQPPVFALGALMHHLSDRRVERLSHGQARANDPAACEWLLRFIEGGLRATLGSPLMPAPAPG